MNERIRELSAIAKNLTTDEAIHLSRVHNRTLSLDELGEIHDQKFAELIVKECARVAFESDLTMAIGQWGADSAILKHFGVEE
jgi:hypothetical protein